MYLIWDLYHGDRFDSENKILNYVFNDILSKGFDSHHGLASHFRDLLVSKTPSTLSLLEVGEQAQKYGQSQKCSQDFLLKGIAIANDCDLKYKLSQISDYSLNYALCN
jgi:DNA polymerase-3 subunit gamma/tau